MSDGAEPPRDHREVFFAREEHDRRMTQDRLAPMTRHEFASAHSLQSEIQKDESKAAAAEFLERVFTVVARGNVEAVVLEHAANRLTEIDVVLDDHHVSH